MLSEQFNLLYPVVAVFLLLAVLVLHVYYTSARHYRIKLLLGPALLAACVFTVPCIGARLGYGWPVPLPASFQYIAHKTVVVGSDKQWIDVMLLSRESSGTGARLHRIPWTAKMEEVLERAERMKEGPQGGDIVVTRPGAGKATGAGDPGYSATRILPRDLAPKLPPQPSDRERTDPTRPHYSAPRVIAWIGSIAGRG